jgi:hypothetical protein
MESFLEVQICGGRAAIRCGTFPQRYDIIVFEMTSGRAILRACQDHQFPMTLLGHFLLTKDSLYLAQGVKLYCARFGI